jgi:hypothetical protein
MQPTTEETQNQNTSPSSWSFPLWPLVFLFSTYVLSTGPAVRLANSNVTALDALLVVYAPLIALSDHCKPIEKTFDWYVKDVWGVK